MTLDILEIELLTILDDLVNKNYLVTYNITWIINDGKKRKIKFKTQKLLLKRYLMNAIELEREIFNEYWVLINSLNETEKINYVKLLEKKQNENL